MGKINVLVLSEVFYPEIGSGASRMTNMVKHLKNNGYKVDVVTSYPNYPNRELYKDEKFWDEKMESEIFKGSKVYRIKPSEVKVTSNFFKRLYIYIIFFIKAILKVLSINEEYDLVIATTPSVFIGVLGVVGKLKFKSKLIVDIRDLWPECLKGIGVFKNVKGALELGYLLESIILKFSDAVVINSDAFRDYLIKKGYDKKIEFIPNGLNKDAFNEKKRKILKKEDGKEFVIIYTGMIGLPQNIRSIVKAANILKDYENIKFKLIGTGIQVEKVKELIKHYGLKNIELLQPMTKENVLVEVEKSSIAILNLRGDSKFDLVMPGKIIDYMNMKKAVIAGVDGYTKNIIEKANCGIAVAPDDYKSMAKAIKELYKDEKLMSFYGNNGYKYCKNNFLWDNNILNLDKLIKTTLGRELDEKSVHVCVESFH